MQFIRKFLPRDNHAVDVMSFGVIILMLIDLLNLPVIEPLTSILTGTACAYLLSVLAIFHLISFTLNKITPLKIIIQFLVGFLFTWIATNSTVISVGNSAMIILGLSNFYAFIININLLKEDYIHGCDSTSCV